MNQNIFNTDKNELSYGRGYVYSLQYHLIWCTKYRKAVLKNGIDEECRRMLYELAEEYKFEITAMEVMPDHIHLLILFDHFSLNMDNPVSSHTTLSTLVRSFKKMVTRELGYSIWQTSFYDRVIRSPEEYCETCKYIEDNPRKWYEKMQ